MDTCPVCHAPAVDPTRAIPAEYEHIGNPELSLMAGEASGARIVRCNSCSALLRSDAGAGWVPADDR